MFERVCTLKKETFPGTLLPGSFCNQEIGHVQFLSSEILLVSVPLLLAGFSYQAIWLLLNSQWNSKFSSFWVLQCSHCENQRKTVGTFCEGLHNKQPIMLQFFFFFFRTRSRGIRRESSRQTTVAEFTDAGFVKVMSEKSRPIWNFRVP